MEIAVEDKVISNLKKIIENEKISHSYLFYGEDEKRRNDIAVLFARAILCKNKKFYCRRCSSCKKFINKNHPDFFEIGDETKKGQSFSILDVREIIKKAYVKPNDCEFKVFLLKDLHTLLNSASNALLKILEEPPENVVFILTATNENGVLKTVFSRCSSFFVAGFSLGECLNFAAKIKHAYSEEELKKIAILSQGNLGVFQQYINSKKGEKALIISKELFTYFLKGYEFKFVVALQKIEKDLDLICLVLSCFLARINLFLLNFKETEFIKIERLLNLFNTVEEVLKNLKRSSNVSVSLSYLSCKIFV